MTESNFSFTTKVNGDLFTVRGNTPDEFDSNMTAAIIQALHDKAAALQDAISGTAAARPAPTQVPQATTHAAPVQATQAAPSAQALERVGGRFGDFYTYGHPDAPELPDGRGRYILREWEAKSGKRMKAWVDPSKGPKPAKPGAEEAPLVWAN